MRPFWNVVRVRRPYDFVRSNLYGLGFSLFAEMDQIECFNEWWWRRLQEASQPLDCECVFWHPFESFFLSFSSSSFFFVYCAWACWALRAPVIPPWKRLLYYARTEKMYTILHFITCIQYKIVLEKMENSEDCHCCMDKWHWGSYMLRTGPYCPRNMIPIIPFERMNVWANCNACMLRFTIQQVFFYSLLL